MRTPAIIICIFWLLTGAAAIAIALPLRGTFPSVGELEAGLNLAREQPLSKLIVARGRAWQPFYVSAKAVGNGEYDVRVRLAPAGR